MSLEDTKENLDRNRCAYEYEKRTSYGIENQNDMTHIHNNEVNIIAECSLLHDIINPPERAKTFDSYYSPILHVCMNTREVKAWFKNFRILLDSEFSSTVLMGRLVEKLCPKHYSLMQWDTQAGNITTNLKVNIDFTLPTLNATNVVIWNFHMDDSAKGGYEMILG